MDGILGVAEVLFFVDDVQHAKQWFIGLLGKAPYFDEEGYCAFYLANTTVGLHPSDEKISSGVAGQVTYWRVQISRKP